jgi:hypothetical protein
MKKLPHPPIEKNMREEIYKNFNEYLDKLNPKQQIEEIQNVISHQILLNY